jgi:radical SAM protein with 4Fe4S-binding SPASM domain
MITFLKKHKVIMSISFEVLEDVQYSQRQQYRRVCATIDRLVAAGVELSFKSIITKQNVNRLEEMVEEVLNRFPSVKKLKLQPADDNAMFATVDELAEFYNAFTRNFFPAMKLGKKNGVDVYCLAYRNLDFIMDHFCSGEICLTPEGTISICHRVSSPQEADYEDFVYGNTGPSGNISFDYEKFRQLMRHDIYNQEKCLDCPARYHCGGGCLAQAHVFDKDKLDVICNWTRDFMRTALAD